MLFWLVTLLSGTLLVDVKKMFFPKEAREGGRQHKAQGVSSGSPPQRIRQPTKWATAFCLPPVSRASWLPLLTTQGSAALHPGLFSLTRFAGSVRKFFYLSFIGIVCCLGLATEQTGIVGYAVTQQPSPTPAPALPLAQLQREFKTLPFKAGEKLVYEIKFTRFPIAAKVGEITFEYVGEWERPNGGNENEPMFKGLNTEFKPREQERFFRLRGGAVSKGVLIAILGIDVNNRYETLVDRPAFAARLHFREIREGKKQQAQSALFEREQQAVNYKSNDLTKPQAEAKIKTLPRQDGMLDLLSAFYFVRLQKLKEGELLRFPVSDDGVNYTFNVVVGKKEQLKTDCGKLNTIKIEPKLFGPGQLFSRSGTMTMWLTADKKHVPVKVIAKTAGGTVSVRLTNFKNNCSIVEPSKEELESQTNK